MSYTLSPYLWWFFVLFLFSFFFDFFFVADECIVSHLGYKVNLVCYAVNTIVGSDLVGPTVLTSA